MYQSLESGLSKTGVPISCNVPDILMVCFNYIPNFKALCKFILPCASHSPSPVQSSLLHEAVTSQVGINAPI